MSKLPFTLTARKDSPYYYVRLKSADTGRVTGWVSTKETNYNRALRRAWEIYNGAASSGRLEKLDLYDAIRNSRCTREGALYVLEELRRRGLVSSWVMNDGGAASQPALQWLLDFWDPDKSAYLKEKERKGQAVHRKHTQNSGAFITNHWAAIIGSKALGELSRSDIQAQFDRLDGMSLNGNTKNHILRAVLTAMRWAYNSELVPKDITKGWTMYRTEYRRRAILTRGMAEAVFRVEWDYYPAKLASMLSMCTGMRCGEILALTADDLGDGWIDVRHSWNVKDGLKCTKNGEERRVFVPFPSVMGELRRLAAENPHEGGAGYVFWGLAPNTPIDNKVFLKYFRRALVLSGLTEEDAAGYTFHSWRHFYATYMADRVNARALQTQTGHKTRAMLEHYAAHQTAEDALLITAAQVDAFGGMAEGLG